MREVEGVYAHWTAEDWGRLIAAREQEERDLRAQLAEQWRYARWLHYKRFQEWAQAEREEARNG